jgi:hypothetical protein
LLGKPLFYNSVTVVTGATTWTQNTDYTVDYTNGKITVPATSTITAGAILVITYQLSRTAFDLSSLTNLRSVTGVEIIYGRVPDEFSGFSLRGTMLTVTTRGSKSQVNIPGSYHLRIAYEARHTPPDDNDDGTVYETDAEVICKGATANLLYAKAISIELDQATLGDDLTSLDAYFSEAQVFFAAILPDLVSARAALVLAQAQVGNSVTSASSTATAVAADLADVATKVTAAEAAFTPALSNLAVGLTNIDTEVNTDLGSAVTVLGSTASALTSAATDIATALTDIALFTAQLTTATNDHTAAIALVNTVNVGNNPQQDYIELGKLASSWAQADINAGEAVLKAAAAFITQAHEYSTEAQVLIAVAEGRLKLQAAYVSSAHEYTSIGHERIQEALLVIENAKARISLLQSLLSVAEQYVKIAGGFHSGYIGVAEVSINAIGQKVALIQVGIAKAAEIRAQQDALVKTAEILRTEATRRYEDFKMMISDRNQLRRSGSIVATTQLG